jgi:hypothetical protein
MGTIAAVEFLTVGSLWYGSLSVVAWRGPEVVRDCYAPLAPGFQRRKSLLGLSLLCLMNFFAYAPLWVAAARHHWRDLETPGPSSPIPGSPR